MTKYPSGTWMTCVWDSARISPIRTLLVDFTCLNMFYLVEATGDEQRKVIPKYPKVDASVLSIHAEQILDLLQPLSRHFCVSEITDHCSCCCNIGNLPESKRDLMSAKLKHFKSAQSQKILLQNLFHWIKPFLSLKNTPGKLLFSIEPNIPSPSCSPQWRYGPVVPEISAWSLCEEKKP